MPDTISDVQDKKLNPQERFLKRDYEEDLLAHDDAIRDFDALEAMASSQVYDEVSHTTKSGLTDSATSTLYLERAARVAGQLPDGEVQAFGKKDTGKAMLMDLLRTKWIYPNAKAQHPFRTKMFLWQYGSSQYGYMPMYYDLHFAVSGYVGPDCWIWNPRNFIPQNGMTSVSDMDYCHAIAMKSPKYFDDLLDEPDSAGWNKGAIKQVIDQIRNYSKQRDQKRDTLTARQRTAQAVKQVQVATRYEAGPKGKWVTFLPDFGYIVLRRINNPHKNSRIPFVMKPCIPTWDSFYNISDFQRSKPMQFANDGLDNFYFEGIKMNLFPPTVVNANGIVKHTVRQEAGAIWMETIPNSARRLETSTAGLATYQAAKGMARGAIQNIAGTTDTSSNAASAMDPSFGKTPQALKKQDQRESTRDNQDRELLEEAMVELLEGMMSIIPTMMTEDIPINMFSGEIQDIFDSGNIDVMEIFNDPKVAPMKAFEGYLGKAGATMSVSESGATAKLTIDPKKLKNMLYTFELEPNSTAKATRETQKESLVDFLGFVGQIPNALQDYKESTGKIPNWEKIFSIYGHLSDVPGLESIFEQAPQQSQDGNDGQAAGKPPVESINYKDAPPDIQAQMEQQAGFQPSPTHDVQTQTMMQSGGVMPTAPAQGATPQPAAPAQGQTIAGMQFNDPVIAAKAQQLEALKSGGQTANANQ